MFRFGWPVLFYPLGAALGLIVLGSGFGRRLAEANVSTIAEIFERSYGSVFLKKIASLLSIISLFMILVAQMIASHKFLVSLGVNNQILFTIFWGIVILYTAQGGLKAVISTDLVQAIFFSSVFILCFLLIYWTEPSIALLEWPKAENFFSVSPKMCGWLLMPLLFMLIEQDMGQRCFAGASPKTVSKASFWAGVATMLICVIPVFLGCLAQASSITIPPGASALMVVVSEMTNPWMAALLGCAVLAAIISTATSLINAICSNLSHDFEFSFLKNSNPVSTAKWITLLISFGALSIAFYFDQVVDLLIQSYELSVCCLFVPVIFALFKKRGNFLSAAGAILCGGIGFIIFRLNPVDFPREVLGVFLSFSGYIAGEFLCGKFVHGLFTKEGERC